MIAEFDIVKTDVTTSNLTQISREQSLLQEARICELYELALHVIRRGEEIFEDAEINDVLSLFLDVELRINNDIDSLTHEKNVERINEYLLNLSLFDKAVLCELICEIYTKRKSAITEADFLKQEKLAYTFVYVKNPFADEAYDVFSQDFENPTVRYAQSFKEALRYVSEGSVSFALLPLEEKGGTRIHSVSQLIFEGDYKIISVTPVFGFDGSADMKYALVAKNFTQTTEVFGDDRYLEIRIPKDADTSLSEILFAAEHFKHGIYRIGTVSFDIEGGPCEFYSIVFRNGGEDFTLLLMYLTLFSESYAPVGIYKNLE